MILKHKRQNFFLPVHRTTKQQLNFDAWFQQCQVDKERRQRKTFAYFGQIAHRGRGEKKKERRIGVDLTSCTGNTER